MENRKPEIGREQPASAGFSDGCYEVWLHFRICDGVIGINKIQHPSLAAHILDFGMGELAERLS